MVKSEKLKAILKLKWITATLLLTAPIGLFLPHTTKTTLPYGRSIEIHSPSFLASLSDSAASRVEVETISGRKFYVDLLNSPLIVIPSTNHNVFFCICMQDPYYVVVRMNIGQPFQKIPQQSPIEAEVVASNCRIDRVLERQSEDWAFITSQVEKMSARQYRRQCAAAISLFGLPLLHQPRKWLTASMRNHGDVGSFDDDYL